MTSKISRQFVRSWCQKKIIHYTFFEKPTSSNQMIQQESALPENIKMATLNSEVVRRMQNVSELLPVEERVEVLDNLAQKVTNSAYKLEKVRQILVGGLSGYEKRSRQSKLAEGRGFRPLHESAAGSHMARSKKKLIGKSTCYKEKKEEKILEDLDKNIKKTKQEKGKRKDLQRGRKLEKRR